MWLLHNSFYKPSKFKSFSFFLFLSIPGSFIYFSKACPNLCQTHQNLFVLEPGGAWGWKKHAHGKLGLSKGACLFGNSFITQACHCFPESCVWLQSWNPKSNTLLPSPSSSFLSVRRFQAFSWHCVFVCSEEFRNVKMDGNAKEIQIILHKRGHIKKVTQERQNSWLARFCHQSSNQKSCCKTQLLR